MPLVHRPGEAQVDFGFAVAKVGGVLRKIAFFVMVLPHSNPCRFGKITKLLPPFGRYDIIIPSSF